MKVATGMRKNIPFAIVRIGKHHFAYVTDDLTGMYKASTFRDDRTDNALVLAILIEREGAHFLSE